jgi:predicted anti-sigma-YlaC factor YlaD
MNSSESGNLCRESRERLRSLLADDPQGRPPRDLDEHLAGCPACRQYWDGIRQAPSLWPEAQPLYTTFLREKTLRTVARRTEERGAVLVMLWAPLGTASLLLSLLLPMFLLGLPLRIWLGDSVASYAAAFLLIQVASLTVAGLIVAAVHRLRRSGFIPFKSDSGVEA